MNGVVPRFHTVLPLGLPETSTPIPFSAVQRGWLKTSSMLQQGKTRAISSTKNGDDVDEYT